MKEEGVVGVGLHQHGVCLVPSLPPASAARGKRTGGSVAEAGEDGAQVRAVGLRARLR